MDAIACDRCQHSMREKWDALTVVSRRQRWMLHQDAAECTVSLRAYRCPAMLVAEVPSSRDAKQLETLQGELLRALGGRLLVELAEPPPRNFRLNRSEPVAVGLPKRRGDR